MSRIIETVYVVVSIVPLAWLGLIVAQTEGSLVSGYAIGAMIPLLAVISLLLVLTGVALIVVAYRRKRRIWPLALATLASSPIAVLVGYEWFFR
jgi:hypothetical protein